MNESNEFAQAYEGSNEAAIPMPVQPIVPILPLMRPVSGLYEWRFQIAVPQPIPFEPNLPITPVPVRTAKGESVAEIRTLSPALSILMREELRLDVDGLYPQRTASGTLFGTRGPTVHWVASLASAGANSWAGSIWYKDGQAASFPYTRVRIQVTRNITPVSARITYSGGGLADLVRTLEYRSPYFRKVNFEFDCAQGVNPVLDVQTHAHPNRPATLASETLSIQTVFRRAGFDVATSAGPSVVPLTGAGPNARWSDQEMHDAMQTYWSKFANAPQWALWTFFASLHEQGTSLGGIMFDDIGPNHRQGTAIFTNAFIANPPSGDAAPVAWVRRMRFWTAAHEMGHAFNLAHSWQKALGTPWIPLANEPEARSFMNYPYNVAGGQTAFFANFAYRFSNGELLFMRHAPERFVQQGNADWFDDHGFEQQKVSSEPGFKLELLAPRGGGRFEFLEPVVIDVRLTNIGDEPRLVSDKVLADIDEMTVIIKRQGRAAREYVPFARKCFQKRSVVLAPGASITDSIFVAVGRNGWDIAEPGNYMIQVALHLDDEEDIISTPLMLHVSRPNTYDEENLASEFFNEDVGRVLAFDGSRVMESACDTLREAAEMLKQRRVSVHARVALGSALAQDCKMLDLKAGGVRGLAAATAAGARIHVAGASERDAREALEVLIKQPALAAETLGHTDYAYYVGQFKDLLGVSTVPEAAAHDTDLLPEVLMKRNRGIGPAATRARGRHAAKAGR